MPEQDSNEGKASMVRCDIDYEEGERDVRGGDRLIAGEASPQCQRLYHQILGSCSPNETRIS